ncbi:hypothetical protein ACFO6R_11225 [Eubacterium multiforme]|uniref:DUF3885 domain-containing protein n=1 Tax=Eubacterium multiforme TaxID=83339 RepID=A0ABT9UVL7_9FIRM|nr:hypothetical protein [Eubacterium multiforme]MDQ0150367.1 hypothetical protein [Eubacterium multiforme]
MKSLSKSSFMNMVNIRPKNIMEGFNSYNNAIITYEDSINSESIENNFIEFLDKIYEDNKNLIVDYYGNVLSEEEFSRMLNELTEEEKNILKTIKNDFNDKDIYFKIENKNILNVFIKLSLRGILFSTFYFVDDEITIWSNYDYKFVVFFNKEETLEKYKLLGERYKLTIKNIEKVE